MERVPEFVEQGFDFVEGQQGRLALGRFGEVEVVGDDRLGPAQI